MVTASSCALELCPDLQRCTSDGVLVGDPRDLKHTAKVFPSASGHGLQLFKNREVHGHSLNQLAWLEILDRGSLDAV